jgi:hypothetical protein
MRLPRTAALASVLLVPVVLTAACTSSGGATPAGTSVAAASGSGSASTPAGSPEARALAHRIRTGLAGLSSAHIVGDAGALGGTFAGDFTYRDGAATASDITLDSGAGKSRVITIGSTSYGTLPQGRNTSGKPWVRISSTSSNEFVRALASTVDLGKAAGSLPAVADIVATAKTVRDKGDSGQGHHYALVIDPSASAGTGLGDLLSGIGQAQVPVDLYLDDKGRPVHVTVSVALGGQTLHFVVDVSKFDAPVHITAPPADQVAAG